MSLGKTSKERISGCFSRGPGLFSNGDDNICTILTIFGSSYLVQIIQCGRSMLQLGCKGVVEGNMTN